MTSSAFSIRGCAARCSSDWAAGAERDERLRNSPAGLASSLRLCGTGTQEPLWDLLGSLPCPVLALAGTDDVAIRCVRPPVGPPRPARCRVLDPRRRTRRAPGPTGSRGTDRGALAPQRGPVRGWLNAHTSKPTVSRTPSAICRRPVAPSIGKRRRASRSLNAMRTGSMASGVANRPRSAQGR